MDNIQPDQSIQSFQHYILTMNQAVLALHTNNTKCISEINLLAVCSNQKMNSYLKVIAATIILQNDVTTCNAIHASRYLNYDSKFY